MKQDISVLGIDLAKNVFQIHGAKCAREASFKQACWPKRMNRVNE